MKFTLTLVVSLAVCCSVFAPSATAQKWEFGGGVGGGFYTSKM